MSAILAAKTNEGEERKEDVRFTYVLLKVEAIGRVSRIARTHLQVGLELELKSSPVAGLEARIFSGSRNAMIPMG